MATIIWFLFAIYSTLFSSIRANYDKYVESDRIEDNDIVMDNYTNHLELGIQSDEKEQHNWPFSFKKKMEILNKKLKQHKKIHDKGYKTFIKQHEYHMKKFKQWLQGPLKCTPTEKIDTFTYPPSPLMKGTYGVWINGKKLNQGVIHKTFSCVDPPKYPKPFYKLLTVSYTFNPDYSFVIDNGFSVKYVDKNGEDFHWEPNFDDRSPKIVGRELYPLWNDHSLDILE